MAITIQAIKALQERTGAGIMDCKKALVEADGNEEKAIDILREKGIAKAAAKAGRTAAEGLALVKICDKCGKKAAIVEVNCETDFVSGSPKFAEFVNAVLEKIYEVEPKTQEEAMAAVQGLFTDATVAMRENFVLRRFAVLHAEGEQTFATYSHGNGRMTSLVLLSKDAGEYGKGIAMTVISGNPTYLNLDAVPAEDRARELEVAKTEVANDPKLAAKPEAVKENIAVRKVDARLGDLCLDHAIYALDPEGKKTMAELEKQIGVKVVSFVRYVVGEGVEKSADED